MLTDAGITSGYLAVLGVAPTQIQIDYWLVYKLSMPRLTDINFPMMLATQIILNPVPAMIPDGYDLAAIQTHAKNYQVAEPQGEVLAVMANWTTPIMERFTFETDIMLSRNGKEQRACRRSVPRTIYEYEFMIYNAELNSFQNQIYAVQGRRIYIPIWSQMRQLGSGLNSMKFLRSGEYLLFSGYNLNELISVVEDAGVFHFATQPLSNYHEGSWLVPVQKGSVRDRVHFSLINERVATGSIQAIMNSFKPQQKVMPNYKTLFEFSDMNKVTSNSTILFESEPNWTTSLGLEFTRPTGLIDFGGLTTAYDLHNFSDLVHSASFTCNRDSYSIRDLFLDMRGRYKAFYMPSFQNDLDIVATDFSGSILSLTVKDVGFSTNVYPKYFIKHLRIEFHTKPAIIVQIGSAVTGVGDNYNGLDYIQTNSLDSSTIEPFQPADVRRVSYVKLVRFNIDALECTWITPDWYTTTASFMGIRN